MYHTSRFSGTAESSDSEAERASAKRFFSSILRMRKTSVSTGDLGGFSAAACIRSNLPLHHIPRETPEYAAASLLCLRQRRECCLQRPKPWLVVAPLVHA